MIMPYIDATPDSLHFYSIIKSTQLHKIGIDWSTIVSQIRFASYFWLPNGETIFYNTPPTEVINSDLKIRFCHF